MAFSSLGPLDLRVNTLAKLKHSNTLAPPIRSFVVCMISSTIFVAIVVNAALERLELPAATMESTSCRRGQRGQIATYG